MTVVSTSGFIKDRPQIALTGRGFIAETFSLIGANNTSAALGATGANSTLCLTAIGLRAGDPVTGLAMFEGGTPQSGSTLFKYALFDKTGASMLKVTADVTANQAVNSFVLGAFSGGAYTVPVDDVYLCAVLSICSTTQPLFQRGPSVTGIGKSFNSGVRACASVASQTDITAGVTLADGVNAFWFGAY